MRYKVADNIFEIKDRDRSRCWRRLESHYTPFATEDDGQCLSIEIRKGRVESTEGLRLVFDDKGRCSEDVKLKVYRALDADAPSTVAPSGRADTLLFEIIQPGETQTMAWLRIEMDTQAGSKCNVSDTQAESKCNVSDTQAESLCYMSAVATIDEDNPEATFWKLCASVTSAIQLAYMLAVLRHHTVMTHSSCVLNDGKAYLFLGKSGTGKSTHSSMWLESIPGTELLNDDHPVLRVSEDGSVVAYGSPWSGKTDCYRNLQAPVGGIIRIRRAPHNQLVRLNALNGYASLMTSLFNMPFDTQMQDVRHKILERIVTGTGMYEMHCLPEHDAARVCHQGLNQ